MSNRGTQAHERMTDASAAARSGSPSDSVSAVREQSGCIQAHHRRHNPAVKPDLKEERSERKSMVWQHLRSRCDSLGLQPRQATARRRRAGGHKGVCCAQEGRDRRWWMAGQKQQQQCAVRLKYGRRGVGLSHEQGSGGRRGALTPGKVPRQ
jgi:hypothetical protein